MKNSKKALAGIFSAIILATTMATTASASSSTISGITVNYSSSINATYATSSSSIAADPSSNSLKAKISAHYVYRNTTTGISESDYGYNEFTEGGSGLQYRAPTGCEMKSVPAVHTFVVNGATKLFDSAASR